MFQYQDIGGKSPTMLSSPMRASFWALGSHWFACVNLFLNATRNWENWAASTLTSGYQNVSPRLNWKIQWGLYYKSSHKIKEMHRCGFVASVQTQQTFSVACVFYVWNYYLLISQRMCVNVFIWQAKGHQVWPPFQTWSKVWTY